MVKPTAVQNIYQVFLNHLNVNILVFPFLLTNNPVISLKFLEIFSQDSLEVDFCWPEIKVKP